MIDISIRDDFKEAAKAYQGLLTSKEIDAAIIRALNKAITAARTDSVRAVRQVYKTRDKDVRKTFKIKKAFGSKTSAELISTGSPLAAYGFLSKRNTPENSGASVNVKGTSKPIVGSFVARMKKQTDGVGLDNRSGGSHIGLFTRFGPKRMKNGKFRQAIVELFTMSIPKSLSNKVVEEAVDKSIEQRLPDLIIRELDFGVLLKTGKVKLGRRGP